MYTVYVIHSTQFDKIYIGYSSDLERRMIAHNMLSTKGYTKKYRPWKVVYTEQFDSKQDAIQREKQLKGGQGRQWIRDNLKNW